jgi:hypothetical protein
MNNTYLIIIAILFLAYYYLMGLKDLGLATVNR